ncbi:MAG TPA: ABC transporter permease [Ilumatobacteraceae bacterium]|nr:ABC transporter permease [Ilumatobacteraceae bacterium]
MGERLARVVRAATTGRAARWIPAVGLSTVQLIFFPVPAGAWVRGVVIGMLTALLAIGLALVYRSTRIVNFAQADLGFLPVSLVIGLVVFWGWPWGVGLVAGLLGAILLGAIVEFAFVRRFRHASRLVLTVATIGITQLLAVGALLMPRWWGQRPTSQRIPAPFDATVTIGTFVLGANDLIALVAAPLAMAAVAIFLDRTRVGIAIRATAERSDRAAMLGIPVSRLATLTWVVASLLSFLALFLRAGILGVPWGTAIGATALVPAIAALAIGQLRDLPAIALTAISLGVLEYGVSWNASSPLLVTPIIGAAVFVTLLARHVQVGRADVSETSSWRLAEEIRPVTAFGVARRRWTVIRLTSWIVLVSCALALPAVLRVDQIIKATAVVAFALVCVSLVVLSGWAGQISLGQVAFFAIGAATSASCTSRWHVDLTLALLVGGAAGAVAALAVGLPALRLQGLYLAVTSLVFALTVTAWLLNDRFFGWVPSDRIERPPLFGRLSVDDSDRFYFYSLAVLAIVAVVLRRLRVSAIGRAIIAVRDNEPAAAAFAIGTVRVKLTAFAIAGGVAGVGGGLFVHLNQSFDLVSYDAGESLDVFVASVVGGLGSLAGAVLGALFLWGVRWFVPANEWRFLASSSGVLLVLMLLPGGLAGLIAHLRDQLVARLGDRR